MNRRTIIGAAVIVTGLAVWGIFALKSSENAAPPPLTGWMRNFTPTPAAGPAPQEPLLARDGTALQLGDLSGRVVLVNFWATWCAPCIRELPSLLKLTRRRSGNDFAVLAVSQDLKGWPAIAPFVASHGLDGLRVRHDPKGALARALGVRGLPSTVLIGRDGRVLGHLTGFAEWDSPEALALINFYTAPGHTAR